MGNIDISRVVIGGLLAGVVLVAANFLANQVLFAEQAAEMFAQLGVEQPGGSQIAIFIVLSFVAGIALVWLYAAIRPRFGAGVMTGAISGIAVWFFGPFLAGVNFAVLGLISSGQFIGGTIYDLVVIVIAAIAGAWLYQERGAVPGATAST